MKQPIDTFHTDLGSTQKIFGGARSGRPSFDITDYDMMFAFAVRLARGPKKAVMLASTNELHALAEFAADCGIATGLLGELIELSDAGAEPARIAAKLKDVAAQLRGTS